MSRACRTCRYWKPYELWDRDPESDCSAVCGYRDAVSWQVDDGHSVPPWVSGSYWCRHHRTARTQLARMWVVDRWSRLVNFVKYGNILAHRYREWKWQRRIRMEAGDE